MPSSRKRKQGLSASVSGSTSYRRWSREDEVTASVVVKNPILFIQAHEADVVRGPQAALAARSLEAAAHVGSEDAGEGLVRWGEGAVSARRKGKEKETRIVVHDDDDDDEEGYHQQREVWVDRYDARLLLDALPSPSSADGPGDGPRSSSPSGWTDLPSDTEDTFFFAPDEAEDYRRDKRRRLMDKSREERLRALRAEEEEEGEGCGAGETWGGSDEEPEEAQKELMRRTARHILSSPNSAQLEMRILANHGGDSRFGFLRGRWARSWRAINESVRMETGKAKGGSYPPQAVSMAGLGGLAGYGDSDDDGEVSGELKEVGDGDAEEAVKRARRARAKEWSLKRRV